MLIIHDLNLAAKFSALLLGEIKEGKTKNVLTSKKQFTT